MNVVRTDRTLMLPRGCRGQGRVTIGAEHGLRVRDTGIRGIILDIFPVNMYECIRGIETVEVNTAGEDRCCMGRSKEKVVAAGLVM